jgi:hypothetical protein
MKSLLSLIFLALMQSRGKPMELNAVVHVEARNALADRIDRIDVVLTPTLGGTEYKATGQTVEISVPNGNYILRVDAPGFEGRRQMINLDVWQ